MTVKQLLHRAIVLRDSISKLDMEYNRAHIMAIRPSENKEISQALKQSADKLQDAVQIIAFYCAL